MSAQFFSPAVESHVDRLVRADKLKLLYHQSFPALFVSLLCAALLCWALVGSTGLGTLALWIGLLVASTLGRLILFLAYFRAKPEGTDLLRWERPYAATLIVSSAIWGLGGLAVMLGEGPVGRAFTFFVLIGMAGGAVSTYSAYRYMAVAAMFAVLLPATLWLALQADRIQIAQAVGAVVFMAASVRATRVQAGALHRSFQLTHELKEAHRNVDERDQHFRFIAEKSGDAIWTFIPSIEKLTYVSPAVQQLLGFAPEELAKRPFDALMTPESLRRFREGLRSTQTLAETGSGRFFRTELELIHRDGHIVDTEVVATLHIDARGRLDSVIAVTHDISERKRDAESIRRLAFFDPLTELPNRRLLIDRLQQAIAHARRDGTRVGVLCIDLDNFKPVNDRHGHQVGDWLLRAVAARLKESVRQSDTAARVGGDEFIVLLADLALPDDGGVAAEKVRTALARPYVTPDGKALTVASSIGVALYPDDAANEWDLLRVGDASMYRAKRSGGNAVERAEPARGADDEVALEVSRGVVRLEWKISYACGDRMIDEEHRELFVKANRLIESAAVRDNDFPAFLRAFDALLEHVASHFVHEEEMLRRRGYSGVDEHAGLHRRLLEQTALLRHRAEERDVTLGELADFLVVEVVGRHLLRADRHFVRELRLA